jgi:hypothetical protein
VGIVLLVALALVVITLWVVSGMPHRPSERWAEAHGVAVVDANRDFIQRYVSEGHRLRLVCGIGGAIAIAALGRGLGISVPVSGWVWLMGGYLGGVVWSEAWLTRLPAGTTRTASLAPRRVRDYLAGRLRVAQIAVPLAALVVGAVALVFHGEMPADPVYPKLALVPGTTLRWTAARIGIGAVALSLGVAWLQRHIVTKPQPTDDPALTAADDAVRASSVHLLSGTATGIVLVAIGSQLAVLSQLGLVNSGTAGLGNLVCWLASLVAWRYYGHRAWVVRRDEWPPSPARGLERVGS